MVLLQAFGPVPYTRLKLIIYILFTLNHVPSRAQTRYKYSYDGKSIRDYYLFPHIAVKLVMDSIPTRSLHSNKTTILLITL